MNKLKTLWISFTTHEGEKFQNFDDKYTDKGPHQST